MKGFPHPLWTRLWIGVENDRAVEKKPVTNTGFNNHRPYKHKLY